jgi:hypothetical protein
MLDSDLGKALTALLASVVLDVAGPQLLAEGTSKADKLERLAEALRTHGMATGGMALLDKFMEPLTDMTAAMLRGLPEVEEPKEVAPEPKRVAGKRTLPGIEELDEQVETENA